MKLRVVTKFALNEVRFRHIQRKYRHHSMVPALDYCGTLHLALKVMSVDGLIVECGTWRGGMIAGMADVLGARRSYYLCDSFCGLPPAGQLDGPLAKAYQNNPSSPHYYDNCTASAEEARTAMAMSGARNYTVLQGWFEETLSRFPPLPIALLRLDADWYDSTKCVLENLSRRVVPGGLIIVDDYYTWQGCTLAVNEFAAKYKWQIRQNHHGVCYIQM